MANTQQMIEQETKDFNTTKKIMKRIFQKYKKKFEMEQNPIYSPIDSWMRVGQKQYNVEIKERQQDMEKYQTLPLKVKKYCNIIENTDQTTTPLIIYLLNNSEYYIFNLNKIDLNKVELKNWNIAKVQYCENQTFEFQPTFFLPLNMAVYNGKIE